jgi:hypothetical protein
MIDPPKNDEIDGLMQEKDAHSNWAVEKYRNQSISSSTNGTDSTDWRVPGFLGSFSKHMLKSSALSGRGHHFRPQVAVSSLSSSEKEAPQVNLGAIPLSWGWVNTSDVARALQGFDLFLSQWVCLKMVRFCLIKCGH